MDQATYNALSVEFDMLAKDAMIWFNKRKRYNDTKLEIINTANTTGKEYACYKKILGTSKIIIYKPSFIEFYCTNLKKISKLNVFFISTIAHELVHRKQCAYIYHNDFSEFVAAYKNNKFEIEALSDHYEYRVFKSLSSK